MKLLDRLTIACRTMNFAAATEECYRHWVEDYLQYHRNQAGRWVHPDQLREEAVEFYLTHLAVGRELSASSQSQALCALVFLYTRVLRQPLGELRAVRAKRPVRLSTVLSVDEVRRVLNEMRVHPVHGLIGQLLYGGGLRVSEGCELRVMDIDFDRRHEHDDDLHARAGAGAGRGGQPAGSAVRHATTGASPVARRRPITARADWLRRNANNGYRRHLVNSVSDPRCKSLAGMDSSAKSCQFGENGSVHGGVGDIPLNSLMRELPTRGGRSRFPQTGELVSSLEVVIAETTSTGDSQ